MYVQDKFLSILFFKFQIKMMITEVISPEVYKSGRHVWNSNSQTTSKYINRDTPINFTNEDKGYTTTFIVYKSINVFFLFKKKLDKEWIKVRQSEWAYPGIKKRLEGREENSLPQISTQYNDSNKLVS